MYENLSLVKTWAAANGVEISPTQLALLACHKAMVLETNKHMNLTAITDPQDFDVKHIIDSLTLLPYIKAGSTLADVGTGAGFPGLILAIMREDLQITLIDSLRKRVFFLQDVVQALGLKNVTCVHTRAEDLARQGITFDICTARAVASLDKLAKWVLPITRHTFLAMKGPNITDELTKAKPAIAKLGGQVISVDSVEIAQGLQHTILTIQSM